MGFAGQVFAARVAIGLAVPSPQAMQEAGGMLSQGAASVFQKMAMMRQQASAKNRGLAVQEMSKTQQLMMGNLQQSNQLMNAEIEKGLKQLADSGRAVASSFGEGGTQFEGLRKAAGQAEGDLGKALFAGIDDGMGKMAKMTRMVQNLAQMDSKQ